MKANIQNLSEYDGISAKRDKVQNGFYKEYSVIEPSSGASVVIFRLYCTGSTIHCVAWFYGNESYGWGYGKAAGYGYCKASAAVGEAIENAGISLSEPIDGRGITAIWDAAKAVAKKLTGKRKFILHSAHA